MTDWRQIAIELYRDGMPRHLIREKLELSASELNSYLVGEPAPNRINRPEPAISRAKREALTLLGKGMDVASVQKRLHRLGLKAATSTLATWRQQVQGPVNKKVDQKIVAEIIEGTPNGTAHEVAAIYAMRTGDKVSHQSVYYWIRKMKKKETT